VYRALDQFGQVIDVSSPTSRRDRSPPFFGQAIGATKVTPVEVVTDQAATYPILLEIVLEEVVQPPGIAQSSTQTIMARRITAG
jgi:hypothetical protein